MRQEFWIQLHADETYDDTYRGQTLLVYCMWEELQSDMYFEETYEDTYRGKTILVS
jgi:hypothetical protein